MAKLVSQLLNTALVSLTDVVLMNNGSSTVSTSIRNILFSAFQKSGIPLTIASGVITPTHAFHTVSNESAASLDTIETINGSDSPFLFLTKHTQSQDVRFSGTVGNIKTPRNETIVLTQEHEILVLFNYGTKASPQWTVISKNLSGNPNTSNVQISQPTLSLDFTKREYRQLSRINESIVSSYLNDVITANRDSLRSYFSSGGKLFNAPIDEFGYCYFPFNSPAGLPIYSETTNLLLYSEDFSHASWTKVNIQSVNNAFGVAPDGENTLNFVLPNTTTGQHSFRRNATTVIGRVYTTSVFIKASTSNYQLRIRHGSGAGGTFMNDVNFNPSTGAITRGDTNARSFYIPYLNVHRVMLPFTATDTTTRIEFAIHADNTVSSWSPDGTSGLLMWGAQTNDGRMTAYTKSAGSSGVSNIDDLIIPLTESWYQDSLTNWTLYFEYYLPELTDLLFTAADYRRHICDIGSDSATRLLVYSATSLGVSRICFVHTGTGVTAQTISNTSVPISELNKVCKLALSWDGTNLLLGYNGQVSTVGINQALLSSTYDRIKLGQQTSSNLRGMNGKILKINHHPRAFTATELVGVTTL